MIDEVLNISLRPEAQFHAVTPIDASTISDDELVTAVLDGDERAFEEIFERYRRPMTRVVSRYFRERNDIEEFVQQCFTKAYFSLNKYRGNGGEASFPAWMTRIAINACYDEFRRRKRKPENLFTEMNDEENNYIETIADKGITTEDDSLVAAQLVEKILAGLDVDDRMAMTLVYSDDYSLADAADLIGISTSNLKSRLFRCRNHLRKRFGHLFS